MNVGWAYMGIAAILVVFGAVLALSNYDPYGDLVIVSSLLFIYKGSTEITDGRKVREADDAESTE
ncbi:hypothetical protein [Halohasta litorea]|uniref:Uncharacterized protein n=1 Tax=Halohasta litorea TaxID=869891 RepID=A0ABD6D4L7_9EURY|nr:hypothetical protein [Halohasta litorea]